MTFLATWIPWFIAAYLSAQKGTEVQQLIWIIFGLFAPCLVALTMIYTSKNTDIRHDFWNRLNFKSIQPRFFPVLYLLIPFILVLSTVLSLLFGFSLEQFNPSKEFANLNTLNFSSLMLMIIAPFVAPIGEELGWRGYGVDSLRCRFNLFTTSLLFGCIWAIWHLPLFFVQGFYENRIWHASFIYVINLFIGSIAAAFLINWVYYKNDRNIVTSIILHFMINFFSILFKTEEFTKCIMTFCLLIFILIAVIKNRAFFFEKT